MRCVKGHEHNMLSCPTCAATKSHDIPMDRMVAALRAGTPPMRYHGHWTLHPDSWRKIATDYNIGLIETKFPTLCNHAEFSVRRLGGKDDPEIAECIDCNLKLDSLAENG